MKDKKVQIKLIEIFIFILMSLMNIGIIIYHAYTGEHINQIFQDVFIFNLTWTATRLIIFAIKNRG